MWIRGFAAAAGALLFALNASAAAQPANGVPLRIIVPYAAGGLADITARLMSEHLTPRLGQTVIVENRPGANGSIGTAVVAGAKPDGNTLGLVVSSHAFGKALMPDLPFDPIKDFEPVTQATRTATVLVAMPGLPADDIETLIAYVKQRPGELAFASPGNGSNMHIFAEQLVEMTGLDMLHIPYKGSAAAHLDLIAGRTQIVFDTFGAVEQHLAAGRLKLLAAGGDTRLPKYPEVRTLAEQGLPDIHAESWGAFIAPAGTPKERIDQLHRELTAVLQLPEIRQRLEDAGATVVAGSPQELAELMAKEEKKYGELIRRLNIQLN